MKNATLLIGMFCAAFLLSGCGNVDRVGLRPSQARKVEATLFGSNKALTTDREERILKLNPEHVTDRDVRETLAGMPAPHVINIHGGLASVIPRMMHFSYFLMGMGYPGECITNPADGTYSFSCYESADKIAGVAAWYYEHDGLRPMLVGHSQGGMQAVKVLYRFADSSELHVWNPLTWQEEARTEITDPRTRQKRPVAGLSISLATSVGAGGLTRMLPNQWDINWNLRSIPDSVDEFIGFCKPYDILGGDFLGYGGANEFAPNGKAYVRNIWLPSTYDHGLIPNTDHLLQSQQIKDWLNNYKPLNESVSTPTVDVEFDSNSDHIIWAAEMWYAIKKHWVIELQTLIRARRATQHAGR